MFLYARAVSRDSPVFRHDSSACEPALQAGNSPLASIATVTPYSVDMKPLLMTRWPQRQLENRRKTHMEWTNPYLAVSEKSYLARLRTNRSSTPCASRKYVKSSPKGVSLLAASLSASSILGRSMMKTIWIRRQLEHSASNHLYS